MGVSASATPRQSSGEVLYKPGEWGNVVLSPRSKIWCLVYLIHYTTFAVLLLDSSESVSSLPCPRGTSQVSSIWLLVPLDTTGQVMCTKTRDTLFNSQIFALIIFSLEGCNVVSCQNPALLFQTPPFWWRTSAEGVFFSSSSEAFCVQWLRQEIPFGCIPTWQGHGELPLPITQQGSSSSPSRAPGENCVCSISRAGISVGLQIPSPAFAPCWTRWASRWGQQ